MVTATLLKVVRNDLRLPAGNTADFVRTLVRSLAQNDPDQNAIANTFFKKALGTSRQGFVSLVVLVEVW
jgi:hypothetical protein